MMKENVLSVTDLCAGYSEKPMVSDVTFSLGKGEIFCIVGESGCGKSTLLKAILGTTPGLSVLSGSIRLGGTELTALPQAERQRLGTEKMGVVFQNPGSSFNPIRSYKKQFIETLKSHRMYDRDKFMHYLWHEFSQYPIWCKEEIVRAVKNFPEKKNDIDKILRALIPALIFGGYHPNYIYWECKHIFSRKKISSASPLDIFLGRFTFTGHTYTVYFAVSKK